MTLLQIDWEQFVPLSGFANKVSARVNFNKLKRKYGIGSCE